MMTPDDRAAALTAAIEYLTCNWDLPHWEANLRGQLLLGELYSVDRRLTGLELN